jgi:XTP/dITP diphosphohydrolase
LLEPLALDVRPQSEFGIEPPPETGTTFAENALTKARNAACIAQLPAIADDSGIEVDVLDGAPGVYSARFAGPDATDADNLAKLQLAIRGLPQERRGARYRCVIAFVQSADDPAPVMAEGVWEGRLIDTPAGDGGFGYDPIFVPRGEERTVAELPAELKNQHSHRGQALRALLQALRAQRKR